MTRGCADLSELRARPSVRLFTLPGRMKSSTPDLQYAHAEPGGGSTTWPACTGVANDFAALCAEPSRRHGHRPLDATKRTAVRRT